LDFEQEQNATFTAIVDLKLITALQWNTKGDILKKGSNNIDMINLVIVN